VNVCTEADVVGEIPAHVVGILVDHDVVAIPEPVAAKAEIDWSNAEIETTEPEAAGASADEVPDVSASEAAGEMSVFPGMVEAKCGGIAAVVMTDPGTVVMDMRSFGMSLDVGRLGARDTVAWGWPVLGNESAADVVRTAVTAVLSPDGKSEDHSQSKKLAESFHSHL
jgi:hypothetical protein